MMSNSGVDISVKNGIQVIKFNSPRKRNAIRTAAYTVIRQTLNESANNPDIRVTVLTGAGDYYSSGFDISDAASSASGNEEDALSSLRLMIGALIDYPKLLIAVVNGPALGLAVTTLALCDIVYASDRATFQTPFSKLSLCAEGCASYTFPRILGKSKASEVLLLGHKMSAEEAYHFGFISKVFKHSELDKAWDLIADYRNTSAKSIDITKKMIKKFSADKLHAANNMEIENVRLCIQSEEFGEAMIEFMSKKSKM